MEDTMTLPNVLPFWGVPYFQQRIKKTGLNLRQKNQLKDKDLVWCWNRNYACKREVRFYDLKNKNTYSFDGEPNGCTFDYYEKYKEKVARLGFRSGKKIKN